MHPSRKSEKFLWRHPFSKKKISLNFPLPKKVCMTYLKMVPQKTATGEALRTHGMRVIGYYTVLVVTFFNTLQQQPWETLDRLVGQNVPKKVASYFEPVGNKIKNSSEAIECIA